MKQNNAKTTAVKVLTAILLVLVIMTGGIRFANAAEDAEPAGEETTQTELEQFIADWGEPYEGSLGTKNYTIDFENYEADTDFSTLEDLTERWIMVNATGEHITKVVEDKSGKYLKFAPFAQMFLEEGLTDKYVFSADLKLPANQGFGMFFRTTGETQINPYFEDDKSGGGGIMELGPNGIYIIPNDKSIKIYVKYYDERKTADKGQKYLNNKIVTLKTTDNFSRNFTTLSIADYGTGAKIFANGALVGTLEFSDIVDGYDELFSEARYYSTVKVLDNTGKEKATVNNTLVSVDTSVLAFGMRISEAYVDNIVISEYQEAITDVTLDGTPKTAYKVGDKFDAAGAVIITTYESGKTKRVAVNESMVEGFDTSSAGEKAAKIVYGDKEFPLTITVSEPEEPTEKPEAPATDAPKPTEKADPGETEKPKNNKPLIIGLIAGGVLIVAIAAVALILKAKSKK